MLALLCGLFSLVALDGLLMNSSSSVRVAAHPTAFRDATRNSFLQQRDVQPAAGLRRTC